VEFTVEIYETVIKLAGCNYTVRQMAIYFGIDVEILQNEYDNKDSDFYKNYQRGRLMAQAEIDMKLLDDAKAGNLTATLQHKKAAKAAQLAQLKDELFGIR
jgi:hypothetical protein